MGSQTRIAAGVIGVLIMLFVAILYSRFSDATDRNETLLPTRVPVTPVGSPEDGEPTIVNGQGDQLPQEAFNPGGLGSPESIQITPAPPLPSTLHEGTMLPPEALQPSRLPSDALLTPAEFEARRVPQWPVPSPLDERRFQLRPSQLR